MVFLLLLLTVSIWICPMMQIAVNPNQSLSFGYEKDDYPIEVLYRRNSIQEDAQTATVTRHQLEDAMQAGAILKLEINGTEQRCIPNQTMVAELSGSKELEQCKSLKVVLDEMNEGRKKAIQELKESRTVANREKIVPPLYQIEETKAQDPLEKLMQQRSHLEEEKINLEDIRREWLCKSRQQIADNSIDNIDRKTLEENYHLVMSSEDQTSQKITSLAKQIIKTTSKILALQQEHNLMIEADLDILSTRTTKGVTRKESMLSNGRPERPDTPFYRQLTRMEQLSQSTPRRQQTKYTYPTLTEEHQLKSPPIHQIKFPGWGVKWQM
jgi:hypothetical protein